MASAAGCISAQWKGALTLSGMKRRTPCALASCAARSMALLAPEITACVGSLSLASWHTSPCAASAASFSRHLLADAQQRRHRALPDRHGRLHGLAADLQQPRGIGDAERAGRGKRGIFAERVAGDELDLVGEAEALLRLEHAHHRQRDGHQRGLRILGQRQGLERALEHDARRASGPARHRPRRTRRGPRHRPWQARRPCRRPGCPAPGRRMRWPLVRSKFSRCCTPMGGLTATRVERVVKFACCVAHAFALAVGAICAITRPSPAPVGG